MEERYGTKYVGMSVELPRPLKMRHCPQISTLSTTQKLYSSSLF